MPEIDFSPLRMFLKTLPREEKEAFASECGTSLGYLYKRMSQKMPFGYQISRNIARKGVMTPQQLRPADHGNYTWN